MVLVAVIIVHDNVAHVVAVNGVVAVEVVVVVVSIEEWIVVDIIIIVVVMMMMVVVQQVHEACGIRRGSRGSTVMMIMVVTIVEHCSERIVAHCFQLIFVIISDF